MSQRSQRLRGNLSVLSLLLLGGCIHPAGVSVPSVSPSSVGAVTLFDHPDGEGSLAIRILDRRPLKTQSLSQATDFDGVYFSLSDPAELKQTEIAASGKSADNTYSAIFTNLPSDTSGGYTLTVGLFRNVTNPSLAIDPAYSTLDDKVGEGASSSIAIAPGSSVLVNIVINAVGNFSLDHPLYWINPTTPTYESGDPDGGIIDTGVNHTADPGIASMSVYALDSASQSANLPVSIPYASIPATPSTATTSFGIPVLPAGQTSAFYSLVVEAFDSNNQLLSRRSRIFTVEEPGTIGANLGPSPSPTPAPSPTSSPTASPTPSPSVSPASTGFFNLLIRFDQ